MRQSNGENIQGEQNMEDIFARISLQLASFHGILQEMRPSRRRVITCPEAASPVVVGVGQGVSGLSGEGRKIGMAICRG